MRAFSTALIATARSKALPCFRGSAVRCLSTASDGSGSGLVVVNRDGPTAIIQLNRAPVNSLNTELLRSIEDALQEVSADRSLKGAVLTSANDGVFSSGLDIMEMYKPTEDRLRTFWTQVQDTYLALYTFNKPIVAAINGHSPAGGCLLALACDYRVMATGKYTIGLNESQLGIVAPRWLVDMFVQAVGTRNADIMLQLGTLVDADTARGVQLVDETADLADVVTVARAKLDALMAVPNEARHNSKLSVRRHNITDFVSSREEELAETMAIIMSAATQNGLDAYMAALKGRKK